MKKVFAILLTAILLFNSVIIPCFAQDNDAFAAQKDFTNAERSAFALLGALGIIDNSEDVNYDRTITRSEYAKYLALLLKSVESYNGDVYYFNDAKDDVYANSLAMSAILNGNGIGDFYPDDNITIRDILTTVFRATGYSGYVEQMGNNLGVYTQMIRKLRINCEGDLSRAATYREVVVLLCDMMLIPIYDVYEIQADSVVYAESENTLLALKWDIYYCEGRVTANKFTSLYNAESYCDENELRIETETYVINNEELHSYLGLNVNVFYEQKDKSSDKKIVCIILDENNEQTVIEAENIISFSDNTLRFYDEKDKEQKITFPNSLAVIYNGKAVNGGYEELFTPEIGDITIYRGEKNRYEVAVIREFVNARITLADTSDESIYTDAEGVFSHISIGAYTNAYVRIRNNTSGLTHNFAHLQKGDVVSVLRSLDGSYIEVYRCTDKITGVIGTIKNTANGSVTVGGTEYRLAAGFFIDPQIKTGDSVTIVRDIKGNVAACDKESLSSGYLYGYIFGMGKEKIIDEKVTVGVYNENGQYLVLEFADKVYVDGAKKTPFEAADVLCASNGKLERQLVRYRVNTKGEILHIDTAAATSDEMESDATLYEITPFSRRLYYLIDMTFDEKYPIYPGETKIMIIPSPNATPSPKEFAVMDMEKYAPIAVTGMYNVGLYGTDPQKPVADFVVYQLEGSSSTTFPNLFMVSDVAEVLDEQGTGVCEISGYANYTAVTLRTIPDCKTTVTDEDKKVTEGLARDLMPGDLISYEMNAAGEVNKITVIYSTEKDIKHSSYDINGIKKIYKGQGTNSQSLMELTEKPEKGEKISNLPLERYSIFYDTKVKFVIYDGERRGNQVYIGTLDDLKDTTGEGDGDLIYIWKMSGEVYERAFFVWK